MSFLLKLVCHVFKHICKFKIRCYINIMCSAVFLNILCTFSKMRHISFSQWKFTDHFVLSCKFLSFGLLFNPSSCISVTFELKFNHSVYNYDMFDYAWDEICWSLFLNKIGLYDFFSGDDNLCLTGLLSWGCLDMKFSPFKWPKRLKCNQLPLWEWFNASDIRKNVFNC